MYFQFDLLPFRASPEKPHPPGLADNSEVVTLLRQLLELQREHLNFLRASNDAGSRWRAFLSRWQGDFPDLPRSCKEAMPILEKTYGGMIAELAANLRDDGDEALETDFALQEFLDRYGMRLAQLGTLLKLVAPLAEAS